jgi:DNA-binding FrmR family transcriptional regulator
MGCSDVLQLIAGARGALNELMAEVVQEHIRMQGIDPLREPEAKCAVATEEPIRRCPFVFQGAM